jgi:brefeldin A-inhibited guanine nucleotide-exchange protein
LSSVTCWLFRLLGIQVKPIIVADMLSTAGAKTSLADITGMTAAVQGFLNNVVAAAGYGAAVETPEQMKQSVAAAIGPRHSMELTEQLPATPPGGAAAAGDGEDSSSAAAAVPDVSTSDEEEDEKNTFHLAPASSSDVAAAAAAAAAVLAAAGINGAADKLANDAVPPLAAATATSRTERGAVRADSSSTRQPGHAGHASAAGGVSQGRALLLKDAFLVFRALCKLSIRTSDSVTISDPTAVRGKVSCQR